MIRKHIFISFAVFVFLSACTKTTSNEAVVTKAPLLQHTVQVDGHPVALWEKSNPNATSSILLVHGRTWSAIPDFDLQVDSEELSLMDGLVRAGYAVFAIDLRGYGATPRDATGWQTPDKGANDVSVALSWIMKHRETSMKPHLFGWSMGSTISHLAAQRNPDLVSSLTLFGYWHDSDQVFPVESGDATPAKAPTTAEAAASDFIIPGSISQKAINAYVKASLKADPIRVDLNRYDQFNELDPAKIIVPTLILQGEFDPIGPTPIQAKLFERLGTSHKQWTVVKGGDHAAFMETPRTFFIHSLVNFLEGVSIK